jgi:hypothetical protein
MVGSNLTILDQIAKFFLLLFDAPSCWFTLNTMTMPSICRMAVMAGTTIAIAADGETTIN